MAKGRAVIKLLVLAVTLVTMFAQGVPVNSAETLRVGKGRQFPAPSLAARAAGDGAIVEIDADIYEGDVAVWTQSNLTIRGAGGRPHLKANGVHAQGKAIWVIKGSNVTIENMEFSGARVPDRNGAGIRGEGVNLTIRKCYFHDNENGILIGIGPESAIVVDHSEFAANGNGDGYTHNIYVGNVRSFTLRGSYSHHARVGHNVKSRAPTNYILYNRLMDEQSGTSSYAVDLPNGGISYLIGNLIQKGPDAENRIVVAYGAEGLRNPVNELYVINNTMVNDRPAGSTFLRVWGSPAPVKIINNLFVGRGTLLQGPGELSHNLALGEPRLVDREHFDYRLTGRSPAIDVGTDPGAANGLALSPVAQYKHPAAEEPRKPIGRIDVGAYEYQPPQKTSER